MDSGCLNVQLHGSDSGGVSRRRLLQLSALAAAGTVTLSSPAAAASGPPAIFYSPHQDDEAIGMAGTILEHKAAGRPVYLVLVTRGENDGLRQIMDEGACTTLGSRCSAPGHSHALGWAAGGDEVVLGRTAEFYASAKAIGVDKVINFALPDNAYGDGDGAAGTPVYDRFVRDIAARVGQLADRYPGASHKFAAGWLDGNPTHKACSDAAYSLRDRLPDLRFNYIYSYQQHPVDDRVQGADLVLDIPDADMARKRAAILAYNTWDPARDLYTLGYHSVPEWLEQASADPREFIHVLPADYRPGKPTGG